MSDGFEKINLENQKSEINSEIPMQIKPVIEPKVVAKRKISKKLFIILAPILFLFFIAVIAFIQFQGAYGSFQNVYKSAKEVADAAKSQNIVLAKEKINLTRKNLTSAQNNLTALSWVKIIPVASSYYNDAQHGVKAAFAGLDAAEVLADSIEPYADILGLKGQGTFTGGSTEERIIRVIETMDKVVPKIDEVSAKMTIVKSEIDQIDINRYPETFKGKPIRSELAKGISLIDDSTKIISEAKPLLVSLPKLLGGKGSQKYLILFQNDKELRSTGGFITAYAVIRVEKGKVNLEKADDIYKLDDSRTRSVAAPAPIKTYLNESVWYIRNANISPDFAVSMKNFEDLYASSREKVQFDGIIAIDTHVLVKLLEVIGPVPAYGTNFTTETVKECDCPMVIYELEKIADLRVAKLREGRKDIIGVLMQAILKKAMSAPKQYWAPLFQTGINEIAQKHVLFYLKDAEAQKAAELFNAAGRIQAFDGDYLHINDTNFGGAKSNMYVEENVEQKYETGSDGTITANLSINYKNPAPASNCNLEAGGLCLNGVLRNWIRVYVPKGSVLVEGRGSEVKIKASEELEKTVFEGFVTVRPLGGTQLELKYTLPFKTEKGKDYRILVQKQPGPEGNGYKIYWNGKLVNQFDLKTDQEVKIKI